MRMGSAKPSPSTRGVLFPMAVLFILVLAFPALSRGQAGLTFARPDGPTAKLCMRVLTEAYGRIGITICDTALPAERSLVESNNGHYDGEVVRVKGIEARYPNLIPVSIPVTTAEGMAFTKKRTIAIDGWESLKPYSIVLRRGLKFAEKGTLGMNVTLVTTYAESFMLVSKERYEVTVCDRLAGYYFTRKFGYPDLTAQEPPITTFQLFHYLHKKHAPLRPEITAALAQMQAEGLMRAIRTAYIDELLRPESGP